MAKSPSTSTESSRIRPWARSAALAALCSLTACGSANTGGGDFGQFYQMTKAIWNGEGQNITLAQAASVPYASMGMRLGDGREAMVVLAGNSIGERTWTSAIHIALTTENGRIVRTAGLEHNLSGYQLVRLTNNADGLKTRLWLADFADLGLYSISVLCRDRNAGPETITILGKAIHTERINESCASRGGNLDWSFHNTYWVDPKNGLAWRTIQNVHPGLDPIETEMLRPPS